MTKNNAPQQRITFITAEIPIGNSIVFAIFGSPTEKHACFSVTKRYTRPLAFISEKKLNDK